MTGFINTGTLSLAGAVIAVLALILFGRNLGKKAGANALAKEKAKTREAETQKQVAQAVSQASSETAKAQGISEGEYRSAQSQIDYARRTGDIEFALRIASNMAQKALEKGASEK